MTFPELCNTLRDRRINVRLVGGSLIVRSRPGTTTPQIKRAIRHHAKALRDTLAHSGAMSDEYAKAILDLWESDVIGPLAVWLWFDVMALPMELISRMP